MCSVEIHQSSTQLQSKILLLYVSHPILRRPILPIGLRWGVILPGGRINRHLDGLNALWCTPYRPPQSYQRAIEFPCGVLAPAKAITNSVSKAPDRSATKRPPGTTAATTPLSEQCQRLYNSESTVNNVGKTGAIFLVSGQAGQTRTYLVDIGMTEAQCQNWHYSCQDSPCKP
jgi:hypothetical protein